MLREHLSQDHDAFLAGQEHFAYFPASQRQSMSVDLTAASKATQNVIPSRQAPVPGSNFVTVEGF